MTDQTFLLLGLGNPGREYARNRHNIGFMFIDRLAVRINARGMRLQSRALVTSGNFQDNKLILAKPQTYMNLSGQAVQGLARFYKVPLSQLLVAHDDLDLPFGTLRLRPGGGPGGQKGVASAIEQLGTQDFARLRFGIDRPPGRMDPADYVLQDFSKQQMETLGEILERGVDAALTFVTEGLDRAMNNFNGEVQAS